MTTQVIIAQIFSVISWFLLLYSYYKKEIKELIMLQILVSVMDILCYIFLGAISGIVVASFELIQGIAFYKTDKAKNIFLLTIPIYIIYALFTYHTPIALLPIIATFIDNLSLTRGKTFALVGGILAQISWAIYDISVLSYVGALTDMVIVFSNLSILVLGYSYIKRISKLNITRCNYLSKKLNNTLHQIDKSNYNEEFIYNPNHKKEIFNKNKESLLLINYKNKVIGYISYHVINKEELTKIINKHKYDINYSIDNIIKFKKKTKNYLIINNISVNNNYQNKDSIDLIIDNLRRYLKRKSYQGFKIEQIISPATNNFEKRVLEVSGFNKFKDYSNDVSLYIMNKEEIDNIFLETGKYKIKSTELTDNDFIEISNLNKNNMSKEELWDISFQKDIYNRNKDSYIIITREDKIIAYLNYLSITKNTYHHMNKYKINDLKLKEIKKYTRYDYNYINIESIVISKRYNNKEVNDLLINTFINKIRLLEKDDYFIRGINSIPRNKDYKKIIKGIGLIEKNKKDNLYYLEEEKLYKKLK